MGIENILDLAETKDYAKKYFETVVKEGDFDDWFKNNFSKYEKGALNFEAHHIIPIDVLKTNPDLQQLLFDLKKADPNFSFDFNGDNMLALDRIKKLVQKSKNILEKEVLLGTKNVNDIVDF